MCGLGIALLGGKMDGVLIIVTVRVVRARSGDADFEATTTHPDPIIPPSDPHSRYNPYRLIPRRGVARGCDCTDYSAHDHPFATLVTNVCHENGLLRNFRLYSL